MIQRFLDLLVQATSLVPSIYFQLPVAEQEDPIYRERVYTYELYHQVRILLSRERDFDDFALSGEIDKQGHPIIRPCAPDFVLHIPGAMGPNLVVVEVKAANTAQAGIGKDRETLQYFLTDRVAYQCGVQLVYGADEREIRRFIDIYESANDRIVLLWHHSAGEPAVRLR